MLSDIRRMQRDYWAALNDRLATMGGPVLGSKKPQPHYWINYRIGRSGFHLGAAMVRAENRIQMELYISGDRAKAYFHRLQLQKESIEQELGYPLYWEERPDQVHSRVSCYLHNLDPEDQADWPRQHTWLAERLNDLYRVFSQRVRTLDAAMVTRERITR